MAVYRTAQGKQIDMAALAARNEKTRAVGNMKVNARGDTIDGTGKVIVPVTEKVGQNYSKTVGNRTARQAQPTPNLGKLQAKTLEPRSQEEIELDNSMEDDAEIEKIKAQQTKK
jgi:hypothetical protein